jgi:8-oxo-dGTP pyrophosphatase MutT (NUDIX family)
MSLAEQLHRLVAPPLPDRDWLRARLLPATPPLPPDCKAHAAVLLCCIDAAEPYTLLTRRSPRLSLHAGQISLPGGRIDLQDDSLEHTALRETHEEIGLDPSLPQVLGRLPDTRVVSGITVTPVVAWCDEEPPLVHNPAEVDEIIRLPLHVALNAGLYGTDSLARDGEVRQFRFLQYEDHYIWGATARILLSMAELLL